MIVACQNPASRVRLQGDTEIPMYITQEMSTVDMHANTGCNLKGRETGRDRLARAFLSHCSQLQKIEICRSSVTNCPPITWKPLATLSDASLLIYNLQPLGAWHSPVPLLAVGWVHLSVKIDLGGHRLSPKSTVGLSIMTPICPASNEEQAIVRVSRSGESVLRIMNYAKGVCSSCKAITFKRNKPINTSGCLKYDPVRRVSRARKSQSTGWTAGL